MNGKVLITGGAGFIGAHLATHLVSGGYEVHLVDNYSRGLLDSYLQKLLVRPGVTFDEIDLLDKKATLSLGIDYDVIIHLAAIIGVKHVVNMPYQTMLNNVLMLNHVIELARTQKWLRSFLFSSTSEVYAGTLQEFELAIPTPETSAIALTGLYKPRTTYMLSKIVGETLCHHSKLPYTIFRPHNIYGPRMGLAHIIPEQLKRIWATEEPGEINVPSAEHTRAFCYIDDAVEMLKRMIENNACSGLTLNLGTQVPEVTMRYVVEICIQISGKDLSVRTLDPIEGSPERRAPDMTLTNKLLDYRSKVGFEEGIEKTLLWYRKEIFKGGVESAI